MALLRYEMAVVNIDKVRAAMHAVEQEAIASNLRQQRKGKTGPAARVPVSAVASETAASKYALHEHERAERAKTAVTEREAKRRAQTELALNRQRSAGLYRQYQADERARRSLEHESTAARTRAKGEFVRTTKGVLGGTASTVASVGRAGIAMTGLAGGALFATATHGAMARQASAAALANQLEGNAATPESLRKRQEQILTAASGTRGFATENVVEAMSKFQGTAGEEAATMKVAPLVAKTALATGADLLETADMMANVFNAFRNAAGGGDKSVDELLKLTDDMTLAFSAMGSIGAVELKDLARVGGDISATGLRFSAKSSTEAIQNAASAVQLARGPGGSKSAEEAATSLRSFRQDLSMHSDTIGKSKAAGGLGMNIWADKGRTTLKALPDIVADLFEQTGGDQTLIQKAVGGRGMDVVLASAGTYQGAVEKAKANKATNKEAKAAGAAAVREQYKKFSGIAMTGEARDVKAAAVLETADKQFQEQMRNLSQAVGKELLPTVIRLIPSIANLVEPATRAAKAFVDFVNWFSGNPFAGLAAVIGAAFTAELAKAGIAALLKAMVESFVNAPVPGAAAAIPGAVTTGATGLGSVLTGAGMNVAPGVAGAALTGGAVVAGAGIMAGLGAMKVGQIHEQIRVEERGAQIASELEMRTANAGIWDTVAAEAQAQSGFTGARKTIGSGIGGGADLASIKAQIADVVSAKIQGGTVEQRQARELAAAMSELTAAFKSHSPEGGAPGFSVNTSNVPSNPAVK